MDPREFFRSFFGLPRNNRRDDYRNFDQPDSGFNPGDGNEGEVDPLHFQQSPFFGMMKEMDEIFHQMENMMQNMDMNKHFSFDIPAIVPPTSDTPDSLRDNMLKQPDGEDHVKPPQNRQITPWQGGFFRVSKKEDSDFDGEKDLNKIFGPQSKEENDMGTPTTPAFRSHYSSVSIRTVRTPDGKVETHRTVRDSSGKEETTVTTYNDQDGAGRPTSWFGMFGPKIHQQEPNDQLLLPESENPFDTKKDSIFEKLFGKDYFKWKDS